MLASTNVSHWAPLGAPSPCEDTWAHYYQMQTMKEGDVCSDTWPGTVSSPTICYVPSNLRNHHTSTNCWWFS